MSLEAIRSAAVTRLGLILPDYSNLPNIFVIEENNERLLNAGYGVMWGTAQPVAGATRMASYNAPLTVSLTKGLSIREYDETYIEAGALYVDIHAVIVSFMDKTYLNSPTGFRGFKEALIEKPKLIIDKQFVQIDIQFLADFVISLNC